MVVMMPVAVTAMVLTLLLGQRLLSPQLPGQPLAPAAAGRRQEAALRALIAVCHDFRHIVFLLHPFVNIPRIDSGPGGSPRPASFHPAMDPVLP